MNGGEKDIDPKKDLDPLSELREEDEESSLPELDLNEPATGTLANGAAAIARAVKHAPSSPGVYRMIDAKGDVLYVGKAKSIKKRVTSYTRPNAHDSRITRMIAATATMEFISTATETEALLLEANLIKKLRPRFNVLLRDDKSFPYILITNDHWAPQILKHRGARTRPGQYYGPFANAGAVNRTVNALQRAFLLRSCSDSFFESRTRPCLLHQIKRCAAPCTQEIDFAGYAELVREANAFLSGRSRSVQKELSAEMETASHALDFERAAIYRDRLAALSAIQSHQGINPRNVEEADVFAVHQDGGYSVVEVFFFRTGQNWGNRAYFPKADRSLGGAEVLGAFMAQFYDDKPAPRLILTSEDFEERDLLAEALSAKSGHRIEISVPQRGERKELVMHALANGREALARKLADTASQQRLFKALTETFGLPREPRRIEVYDNSHISGTNAVGGMIVAGPEGFRKNQYRKFNIRSTDITPGDDYGMMREVLRRRFKRLIDESPRLTADAALAAVLTGDADDAPDSPWPDLVLIDGGRGQVEIARQVFVELGLDTWGIVGVAKGEGRKVGLETLIFADDRAPLVLGAESPALMLIAQIRDEAHRFAITGMRARRAKARNVSRLEDIDGIGAKRRQRLLARFGGFSGVASASIEDLASVEGISPELAERIYFALR